MTKQIKQTKRAAKRTTKKVAKKRPASKSLRLPGSVRKIVTVAVVAVLAFFIINAYASVVGVGSMDDFVKDLKTCESGKYEQKYPFGNFVSEITMKKDESAGKCITTSSMPNNGTQVCKFDLSKMSEVSDAYRTANAQMSGSASASYDSQGVMTSQESDSPLQKYLDDNTCTITGY